MPGMDAPSCGWCKHFSSADSAKKPQGARGACTKHSVILPVGVQKRLLCADWTFNVAIQQDRDAKELSLDSPGFGVFKAWLTEKGLYEYADPGFMQGKDRPFEIRFVSPFEELPPLKDR